ncbi:hypothetical protein CA54_46040 [Symmachiella macrocystis]|uniref:Uncharacterized protein n=1 Tax=Symmachiella macrocystis TaxID=2527985 RepID=A0A5C6BB99_9PLAN|nr:hypothetical protein CA54_46040 [Symmachiella macrocystis]
MISIVNNLVDINHPHAESTSLYEGFHEIPFERFISSETVSVVTKKTITRPVCAQKHLQGHPVVGSDSPILGKVFTQYWPHG